MTTNPYESSGTQQKTVNHAVAVWRWPSPWDAFVVIPIAVFVYAMCENVPQYIGLSLEAAQHASRLNFWTCEMLFNATQALRYCLFGVMGIAVALTFTHWASANSNNLYQWYRRFCWLCIVAVMVYLIIRLTVHLAGVGFFFVPDLETLSVLAAFLLLLVPLARYKLGYVALLHAGWNRIRMRFPFNASDR